MILTILCIFFTVLAVIDLLSLASARREAKKLAGLLYATPLSDDWYPSIPERCPLVLQEYIHSTGILEQEAGSILRMRQKGSILLRPRGSWQPFEGKFFISAAIPAMVKFADVTTGLLCSRSILQALMPEGEKWSEKRWGLNLQPFFPGKGDIHNYLLLEYFAAGVWCPYAWLRPSLSWEQSASGDLVVRPDPALSLTLCFGSDGFPKSLSGQVGDSIITYTYFDYQDLGGMLLPLQWEVEISRPGIRHTYLRGQITDIVTKGNFAWW